MHTQVLFIDKNKSFHYHKFAEFREYIQLEHHFSHNVQIFKTKIVDLKGFVPKRKYVDS